MALFFLVKNIFTVFSSILVILRYAPTFVTLHGYKPILVVLHCYKPILVLLFCYKCSDTFHP